MISFKLNDKPLKIASSWEDVTFKQYMDIFDLGDDYADLLRIFTGLPKETIQKARIKGLDHVLTAISFLNAPPDYTNRTVTELCGTKMPKDVTLEHLGPFEDMREVIKKDLGFIEAKDIKSSAACKAEYCSIYLQYTRGEYDFTKAKALIPEVMTAPAMDVLQLGSFFLIKLLSLNSNTTKISPTMRKSRKKSKPTSKHYTKRLGRTRR